LNQPRVLRRGDASSRPGGFKPTFSGFRVVWERVVLSVVADNGSTNGSQAIVASLGTRVVPVPSRGYGSALRAGIDTVRGKFVIMGDSDDSYDFGDLDPFLSKLRGGYQLVMGNRFRGGVK